MTKKVNLFIVGEQKAGTTYLYNYLNQHPQVSMSVVKEPSFFCKDLIKDSISFHQKNYYYDYTNLDQYHNLFKDFSKKVVGEASSTYLYSKKAAEKIHQYNPEAKIIISLREPVSFLYSLHNQYLKETTEDVNDFLKAYNLTETRKKSNKIPSRVRSPSLVYYKERIKYVKNLKRYLKYFPKDQIKIIIFEKFIEKTDKTMSEILSFLSIKNNVNIQVKNKNPSRTPRNKFLFHAFHNPKFKKFVKESLPDSDFSRIKNVFNKLFLKKASKSKLPEGTRQNLKKEIKTEVVKLNKLLTNNNLTNIDLINIWNYK